MHREHVQITAAAAWSDYRFISTPMYPNRNSLGVTPLHSLGMHPTVTLPQKMRVFATSPDGGAPVLSKPSLPQSIALGGAACVFTVNFTHPSRADKIA